MIKTTKFRCKSVLTGGGSSGIVYHNGRRLFMEVLRCKVGRKEEWLFACQMSDFIYGWIGYYVPEKLPYVSDTNQAISWIFTSMNKGAALFSRIKTLFLRLALAVQ